MPNTAPRGSSIQRTGRRRRLPLGVLGTVACVLSLVGVAAPAAASTPSAPRVARAAAVTLTAPASIVRGDEAQIRGRVGGSGTAEVVLQSRASAAGRWSALDRVTTERAFRFTVSPERTTWYRALAVRGNHRVRSEPVRVVVSEPVLRWFDLYDVGTVGGDADGFGMSGSIYAGDWHDEYGYDGFESEVGPTDPRDDVDFGLTGACTRLTGAVGTSGNAGEARVRISGDDGAVLLDRTFGVEQWQRLDVDVTGAGRVEVSVQRASGELTTHLLGFQVRCDSRFGARPPADDRHHWRALYDLGSVDGDADGFAADGSMYSGDWHDAYGYDGFAGEVTATDVEDWVTFAVPRGCSRLDAALGTEGYGLADLRITDQDGRVLHQREHGDSQWQRLDLRTAEVRELRLTATSTVDGDLSVYLLGARLYCSRR